MADFGSVTCITIVAESILEGRILDALRECGARGWTAGIVHGQGIRDSGLTSLEGGSTRVETLVSAEVAARIWQVLETDFFPHYAVIAWAQEAKVARLGRYSGSS